MSKKQSLSEIGNNFDQSQNNQQLSIQQSLIVQQQLNHQNALVSQQGSQFNSQGHLITSNPSQTITFTGIGGPTTIVNGSSLPVSISPYYVIGQSGYYPTWTVGGMVFEDPSKDEYEKLPGYIKSFVEEITPYVMSTYEHKMIIAKAFEKHTKNIKFEDKLSSLLDEEPPEKT